MLALVDLQSRFRNAVLGGDGADLNGIVADDRLGFARRIKVYRNNTRILLREALAANFPVVHQLLGEDFFAALTRAFVCIHPPRDPCLFAYGDGFADFIATFPGVQGLPYLADAARLDWAQVCALYAADAPVLDGAALAAVAPEAYGRLVFTLHPATRMVDSPFPVHAIWALHQPGAVSQRTVALDAGGEAVLITRPDGAVRVTRLHTGDAALIDALRTGARLDDAFAEATAATPDFDAAHALTTLLLSGALSAYTLT